MGAKVDERRFIVGFFYEDFLREGEWRVLNEKCEWVLLF